jgi:hypothetical protein
MERKKAREKIRLHLKQGFVFLQKSIKKKCPVTATRQANARPKPV